MLKKPREQIDISILYNTINDIRKNPSKYQNILSQHLSYINSLNNEFNLPNKPKIILKEGVQAFKEAITFLETLKPMSSLRINFGLVMFAQYVLGDRLKNQNKMELNISNEKFKKYGSFDLLEEIVFADTFLNYTDNYDEIVILNLLVCDGEPKRIFRNAIFSREYNEIGIAVNLWDNDIKIGIEIITAKNFVSKCKIKDGLLTELENKAQSFQEKKQKIIEEAENEINERVKKSDLYTNKNYFDIKEEKHVFFNEELNLLSVYKTFLFLYENGGESEISISKAIKCE